MRRLRARPLVSQGPTSMLLVESVDVHLQRGGWGAGARASVQPLAVIVCTEGSAHALDMASGNADLDRLRRLVPELGDMIDAAI